MFIRNLADIELLWVFPAWVHEMADDEARMELVLSNEQGQLYPLERGLHALQATENGLTLRAYAERIGKKEHTVHNWRNATQVPVTANGNWKKLQPYMQHLSEIHAAPEDEWPEWVAKALENNWTVEQLREALKSKASPSSGLY